VTVRFHLRPLAAAAALLAVAAGTADAQRRPPRPDTPFLTVQVFRSADKIAGPVASDALRDELIRTYPGPVLWVIEKERLIELLEQSGYPSNEQLARSDENALAKFQRADEYVRGSVTLQDDGQYRIDAQLVLTRDMRLVQPLAPAFGNRADRAARNLVRTLNQARDQLPQEKRCMDHARNRRYDQAIAEADRGIASFPGATLVRYCKLSVLIAREAPNAEKVALAEEILELDPNSYNALAVAADAYQADGNTEKANEYLVRLLAADPNNASLAQRVVDALAASRQYDVAKRIVEQAVQDNPGDIGLLKLRFLILASAGDYVPAIRAGEELAQLDTAVADLPYFNRLSALYLAAAGLEAAKAEPFERQADSLLRATPPDSAGAQALRAQARPDRAAADSLYRSAAATANRGSAKFPADAGLWQFQAQALRSAGDIAGSIAAARKALEINPFQPAGWLQVAQGYMSLQQNDSAVVALRNATAAGDNADIIAGVLSSIGNTLRVQGGNAKSIPMLEEGMAVLFYADTVGALADEVGPEGERRPRIRATGETRARVKFILGATAVTIAREYAEAAASGRSCEMARKADDALVTAQINLPGGAAFNQQAAVQLLQSIPEFQAYIAQITTQLCR
jgi:tetratricopeptide (TPR) repeat protein